jgi:menaquinone-specific isochorismate synthase
LGVELMNSEKERREHNLVARMLQEQFQEFCHHVAMDEQPSLMRLRNVQHLYSRLEGLLHTIDVDADLIEALHPTPAVGGYPREHALKWIEAEEPFDRGIYAAPVGWVGYDGAEFCVAIRSGLVQANTLTLYSGAGIVAGSTPEEEWDEIETKMQNFLSVLTQND